MAGKSCFVVLCDGTPLERAAEHAPEGCEFVGAGPPVPEVLAEIARLKPDRVVFAGWPKGGLKPAEENVRDELAALCHEVRTPMNVIAGMCDLLMHSGLDTKQQGYAEAVKGASEHLLSLMNDVLDVAKIEAGKLTLEQTRFDLYKLLEYNVKTMHLQTQLAEFDICLDIAAGLPRHVRGDPRRLNQILFNLLSNAIKYTEKGSITVSASLGQVSDTMPGPALVRIAVSDTGQGISLEDQERIIARYEQGKGAVGGTGLGLAISRQLARLMGGDLGLESEPGRGSTFFFSVLLEALPGPGAEGYEAAGRDLVEAGDGDEGDEPLSGRILVAEDFPTQRQMIAALLTAQGCEVMGAANGKEAVELFARGGVDMVLLDMQMPVMDGVETARRMRDIEEQGGGTRVPIIALTGDVLTVTRETALEAGMDGYLRKPVKAADLYATVAAGLAGRAGDAAASEPGPVDFAYALEMMDNQRDVLMVTCLAVIGNFPIRLVELKEAVAAADWDTTRRLAHSFKSMARNMGGFTVADGALAMETAVVEGRREEVPGLLQIFECDLEAMIEAIERFIQGG